MDFGDITGEVLQKEIENAIMVIAKGGQEYRIGNQYVQRADLSALYKIRSELASQQNNGWASDTSVAVFEGR